ncbi:MAG: protein translocase subunit SecF [Clostridia bacterium]|nr:protein translocase subunit SecF [Clostridia bacterium]
MKVVEKRKISYIISLTVICLGFIFMAYNGLVNKTGIFNFGIDFKGGTVVEVDLGQETDINEVKDLVLAVTNDKNAQVQEVIDSNHVIVKLSAADEKEEAIEETSEEVVEETTEEKDYSNDEIVSKVLAEAKESDKPADLVLKAFELKYQTTDESLIQLEDFASTVGDEMTKNALTSILLACLAILIYVAYRFRDIKMGFAAILALCHDVLVVLAFAAIFRLSIGNSFIAAILTVVGYSINNTIVIFDRIRENAKGSARAHKNTLVDKSVKETLTRSINTSVTTLVSVLALYVLGVDSIREFILPIIVGLVAGTFSSIAIAAPLWYDLLYIGKTKPGKAVEAAEEKVEAKEVKKAPAKKDAKKITKNPQKAARKAAKNSKKK